MRRLTSKYTALLGGSFCAALCALPASGLAQISSINSAAIVPRLFNDVPGATFASINAYSSAITLSETGVSQPSGYADRDAWYFSNNGGASPYQLQFNNYFQASFGVTLTGGTAGYDLEAGILLSDPSGGIGGDIQLPVTNAGVVFQGGGPSYYPFSPAAGGYPGAGGSVPNYVEGETYTMLIDYTVDPSTHLNAFEYAVNGQYAASSPGDPYFDLGPGAGLGGAGDYLGGYFQIGNDPNNPAQSGQAVFSNISIVPEPTTLALLAMGIPCMLRRRRRA
jgi:hypothetical protein